MKQIILNNDCEGAQGLKRFLYFDHRGMKEGTWCTFFFFLSDLILFYATLKVFSNLELGFFWSESLDGFTQTQTQTQKKLKTFDFP